MHIETDIGKEKPRVKRGAEDALNYLSPRICPDFCWVYWVWTSHMASLTSFASDHRMQKC